MKYRTKLLWVLVCTALATNMISFGFLYYHARKYLLNAYRAKVLSIAASGASVIDGDALNQIRTRNDETSSAYLQLRDELRTIRDANRREDTYVKYLYTLRQVPGHPDLLEFVVDSEENVGLRSHVGDIYHPLESQPIKIDQYQVDQTFSRDQWGRWLSAYAPIRDHTGHVVGSLSVDVSADRVESLIAGYRRDAVISTLLTLLLAVVVSIYFSGRSAKPLRQLRLAIEAIRRGDLETQVKTQSKDEFGAVAEAINAMTQGLRERETVKSAFARYVSRQVMDTVLSSGEMPTVKGDRRKITVLFCDIRGFTSLSEKMRPEEVVQLLNEYFEAMVEVIFRNQGTLDKFIGDGMMVIFGAPKDDPYQEEHAVRAALEMQQELRRLTQKWGDAGKPTIRIGIGINSGVAIVGNIGASTRMDYTAIGDTVNLASRLESATKEVGVEILISEYTYNVVRGAIQATRVGPVQVRGRSDPVVSYTVDEGVNRSNESAQN